MKRILNMTILLSATILVTNVGAAELEKCAASISPVFRAIPYYPSPPVRGELNGWVIVEFVVSQDGTTKSAVAVESSSKKFERPAVKATLETRFENQSCPCIHRLKFQFGVE